MFTVGILLPFRNRLIRRRRGPTIRHFFVISGVENIHAPALRSLTIGVAALLEIKAGSVVGVFLLLRTLARLLLLLLLLPLIAGQVVDGV